MPGQWQYQEDGGYWGHSDLSRKIRFQAQGLGKLDQLAGAVDSELTIGRRNGDTVLFNRIDLTTDAGGKINETDVIPETEMPSSQASLVVTEWGISIPYTGKLDALAEFNPRNIYHKGLTKNQVKTFDTECRDLLRTGLLVYTPTGTTAAPTASLVYTGTAGAAAARQLVVWDLRELGELMKWLQIEPIDDAGNYLAVVGPSGARAFMDDSEWRDFGQYAAPDRILNGEVGKLYNFRVVEENLSLNRYILTNAGADTTHKGEAFFMGADALAQGITIAAEIRAMVVPQSYGRQKGVAWYALKGYCLVWNNHAQTEAGAKGRARFIKLGST